MSALDSVKKEFKEGNLGGILGGAIGGAAGKMIGGGYNSSVGNIMGTAGQVAAAIPGPWGMGLSLGLQIGGGTVNGLFGEKVDEEALKSANQGTNYLNSFKSNSNTFDGITGPVTQKAVGNVYKGGLLNKGDSEEKNLALQEVRDQAYGQAWRQVDNNVNRLISDQLGGMFDYNNRAFGGWLSTNGTDWPLGFSVINNGGTHEQNPLGGVLMGTSEDGEPNLVEEGEVKWDDYMFSNRLKLSKKSKKDLGFSRGGVLTYADAAKKIGKTLEERPNDFISKAGFVANMNKLRADQENVRQKNEERQAMNATIAAQGGPLKKKKYKDWYKTVPEDRNDTSNYNLEKAYEVLPEEVLENWRTYEGSEEEAPHLPTVYYNEDLDEYEFLKSSKHPTLKEELKWYNSDNPEAIEFRDKYKLDKSGDYYKYVRKKNRNKASEYQEQYPNTFAIGGHLYYGGGPFDNQDWYNALSDTDYQTMLGEIFSPNTSNYKKYVGNRGALWADALKGKPGVRYNGITNYYNNKFNQSSPVVTPLISKYPSQPSLYAGLPKGVGIGPGIFKNDPYKITLNTPSLKAPNTPDFISNRPSYMQPINTPDFHDVLYQGRKGTMADTRNSFERWMDTHVQNSTGDPFVSRRGKYSTSDTSDPFTYSPATSKEEDKSSSSNWLTNLRYVPALGSALSVFSDLAGWTNKADYSNARMVENAARNIREVNPAYVGDYIKPQYFDRLFYANQANQQAGNTYRTLANMAGGNSATASANIIAAMNGAQKSLGEAYMQGDMANRNQDMQTFDRNSRTNMFNAENYLKAQMAGVDKDRTFLDAMSRSAAIRDAIDQRIGAARSLNLTNLFDNIGNIGREEFSRNMINSNPAFAYTMGRNGILDYRTPDWENYQRYIDSVNRKCGGYLTIKNKRRRR